MKVLKIAFASLWSAIPLMGLYAIACAVATFIENDYGTAIAKTLVYNTLWFNILHVYLLITLVGCLITFRTWQRKRYASFLFHLSLIVIILGAGITRYFGFEGTMHIREGEKSDFIYSSETYLNIIAQKGNYQESFHIPAHLIAGQTLKKELSVFGTPLEIEVQDISKMSANKKDMTSKMVLNLNFHGGNEKVELIGGIGLEGKPVMLQSQDEALLLSWGIRKIALPFSIALKDFQLERYPGSMSPSSYASEVEVIDDRVKISKPFRIYMNHVLDYDGYRFFQSSYDSDEKGTILSVNNDPGKNMTYLGYALLILGCIWLLLDPNGRFRRLGFFLKSQKILCVLVFSAFSFYPSYAQEDLKKTEMMLNNLKNTSAEFARQFDDLLVQDYGGRIKPINTLATDLLHKITKKDGFLGFDNTQLFLGMMMLPEDFQKLKMIKISNPELKKLLGVEGGYLSFREVFTPDGVYILQNYVEEANIKKPSARNTFDKDVIAVDERINLAYMIYTGEVFKVFPDTLGSNSWHQPLQAIQLALSQNNKQEAQRIGKILQDYVKGFSMGVLEHQWGQALEALDELKAYQKQFSPDLFPSDSKIKAEIFLNKNNLFKYLIFPYLLGGIALFGLTLFYIFRNKTMHLRWVSGFYTILAVLSVTMSVALILRWYISGHAPWSNAYESMLYISWATSITALVFFRKSSLAISASLFLSGICLFVADLGFMDPQIGNLVPVLKSYWLNIHVSVITASYGFLALCFMLGLMTLLMFILRNEDKPQIDQTILSLSAINEMAMILGVFMLTAGNFLGGIWANESWGRYWGWDPKETWSLISIGVYAIILHLRFLGLKNMPYVLATASSVGFFSILMTYFGVNYYLSGMHSYAAGDPVPVPVFVYVMVAGIALLIALAYPKRKLAFPALKKIK
ncbi:cytochrome c biogenesis protein CcsA [Helicobacter kayseriensis]|uniref:cytochrome c biogenesis protein CcsA n=1 Tax=Helicobacter kayseriensis TaxID=2905877 RepID=UPI001E499189|nr:cytochrome c biogenesis protein CcsA [Helicobacter kayseriensis]MCE3047758.1 cytochrome c biogenesis protein CcsA [Helicobacter kayseriensis]MCE3049143.1 cytochrome c biogenesis protein CcsA [Helicobacter kayseriensis]